MSPAEIEALLANNGTLTNIETETITASIYQISSRFRGPIHYSSRTWKTTREEISLPVHLSSHKGCSFRDGIRSSFLNAFYRMASRRGLPEEIFSDNGTNFKGADA